MELIGKCTKRIGLLGAFGFFVMLAVFTFDAEVFAGTQSQRAKPKPFIIPDDFKASEVCDGHGQVEILMDNDTVQATTRPGLSTKMIKNGMPSAWCHGLQHIFIGKVELNKYIFESDLNNPLQFVIDRQKGYVHQKGKGTVTAPDGSITKLPIRK